MLDRPRTESSANPTRVLKRYRFLDVPPRLDPQSSPAMTAALCHDCAVTEPMPAERLSRAVPLAISVIAGIDSAPNDSNVALNQAVAAALEEGEDVEAVVLALANMAHAAVATLARQTGTPVEKLLASLGQVTTRDPDAS